MAGSTRMPPPGGHGVAIVIGVPKSGDDDSKAVGRMPPPGSHSGNSSKVPPEEAHLVLSGSHCIDCTMYHPDTGECDKVEGIMDPQDGCYDYFEAADQDGSSGEPDADDAAAGDQPRQ